MKYIQTLVLAFLFLGLFNPSIAQINYFPLEKGKTSTFKYSELFSRGDTSLRFKLTTLANTEQIKGKEYFIVEASYGSTGSFATISTSYIRQGENESIIGLETKEAEEFIFLEKPYEVGKSWQQIANGVSTNAKIVNNKGSLKVPDKTFTNCLVIETENSGIIMHSYFQKNLGLVATVMIAEGQETVMTYLEERK